MSSVTIFTDEALDPYMIVYENKNFRVVEKAKRNKKDGSIEDVAKQKGNYTSITAAIKAVVRLLLENKKKGDPTMLIAYLRSFRKIENDISKALKYVE